ncbi:MAG: rhomboid family intramembrane serine protease [Proteobacteria bacterium]|nr:rhomboid family intramembrane serine protease [Pseudomonadota bacterium]MBU1737382.1 rhomboid family intramembrane serine protease [Pseudomonadota bacterium]
MFPLKDDVPSSSFPAINLWLIIVNVLCFVYELMLGDHLNPFLSTYGFVPARFMAAQAENYFDFGRFLPVFSSMFLHGGFLHVISNMWMLWIFGDNVEDSMGHGRYLFFYLLCGFVSVFAQGLSAPGSVVPMIGASGAISGVLGAYFVLHPRARITTLVPIFFFLTIIRIPAFVFLGFWILLQILQGSANLLDTGAGAKGGVAWWAHVGGFVMGFVLIHLFRKKKGRLVRKPWYQF